MKEDTNIDYILYKLLANISVLDFRNYFDTSEVKGTIQKKHRLIPVIDNLLLKTATAEYSLCRKNNMVYLFNGKYWQHLDFPLFKDFLGEVALKSGVDIYDARFHQFKDDLLKQFLSDARLKEIPTNDKTLINLKNGTFEISTEQQILRSFQKTDFLTYQLPFEYDPKIKAPLFMKFLNHVLPDRELQNIVAEYLGYIFIKNGVLKLEKVLLLYGTGANGKSVLFEVISALLGSNNITNFSLSSLTDQSGNKRAMIANKLLNYASEINGRLETDMFKLLASGEPIEARLLYQDAMIIKDYAKLMFNCNDLPKPPESNHAYFRRLMIIPFNVTIPSEQQDKELAKKIIDTELSGVFNWVLKGLDRLLKNKSFSPSRIIEQQIKLYETESDSVSVFLTDEGYEKSSIDTISFTSLFQSYSTYCKENEFIRLSNKRFAQRLEVLGFSKKRLATGNFIYIKKII